MATFEKFECFVGDLGDKVHDLDADDLKIYLTNAPPSTSADSVKLDLAEIAQENGYPGGQEDIAGTWSEAVGVGTLAGTDVTFTATAGGFGPFQYAVLYNDTPSATPTDPLIAWWDYGSEISCSEGETFTVNFDTSILTIE